MKFELVDLRPGATSAGDLPKLVDAAVDDIGKQSQLSVYQDRSVSQKVDCDATDMQAAVRIALDWLRGTVDIAPRMEELAFVAVRVVHGAGHFNGPAEVTTEVKDTIKALEELAPLHNQSSLEVLDVLNRELPGVRQMVAFDTAFHQTLPEVAWRYPIERETADRFGVRKFGFHGLSHRFLLEQYAAMVGKPPQACTLITLHLESGSSACAIRDGVSVDTTMGLTPLEGLMMGSRCGSIDPAIVPFLMAKMDAGSDEVMKLLEKRSGLLGIAGGSLDTRVLVERDDRWAKLALEMFSYRVRIAVGGYLAVLGEACEAVVFGGGIGEDSPWLRAAVGAGLQGWGLQMDEAENLRAVQGTARISTQDSRLAAWSMAAEEGLQIVWECSQTMAAS